jgi:hypothetical protein
MKRLALLALALGAFVVPAQAQNQNQKPVEFNGMVFDAPAAQGYSAQAYEAPQATSRSTAPAHVKKHHQAHSASQ